MAAKATTPVDRLNQLLDDADVRDNVARAAESIRQAARQLATRQPAKKAAKNKKLQRRLLDAASSLGRAGTAARKADEKRARSRKRRMLLLGLAGGAAAIAASPPARTKLQGLFDGHEETPESPPPPDTQITAVEPS